MDFSFDRILDLLPNELQHRIKVEGISSVSDLAYFWSSESAIDTALSEEDDYTADDRHLMKAVWRIARTQSAEGTAVGAAVEELRGLERQRRRDAAISAEADSDKPLIDKERKFTRMSFHGSAQPSVPQVDAPPSSSRSDDDRATVLRDIMGHYLYLGSAGALWIEGTETSSMGSSSTWVRILDRNLRAFDTSALKAKLSTINAFRSWLASQGAVQDDLRRPKVRYVADYLLTRSGGGPTAASNVFWSFDWWERYVCYRFPSIIQHSRGSSP